MWDSRLAFSLGKMARKCLDFVDMAESKERIWYFTYDFCERVIFEYLKEEET